ncbi:MAG: efflux RND transporter permease subunit [Oligoflexales bacterium]
MSRLIEFFVHQKIFVHIVTFFIFLSGVFATLSMNREAMPYVSFDSLSVRVIYPSASPDMVEATVTNPLENRFHGLDGLVDMSSSSTEGLSSIRLRLNPDEVLISEVEDEVADILQSTNFPSGVTDFSVKKNETKIQSLLSFALSGLDQEEMRPWVLKLQRELEGVKGIASVTISGLPPLEVRIDVESKKQRNFQMSFSEMIDAIKSSTQQMPAGLYYDEQDGVDRMVRAVPQVNSLEDIRKIVLRNNFSGQALSIGDFAKVSIGPKIKKVFQRVQGEPVIHFQVSKKSSYDTIRTVEIVREKIHDFLNQAKNLNVIELEDRSERVSLRVRVLSNNLLMGLFLVLLILSLMLPWKAALVASMGVPFAFCATMLAFQLWGVSLNLISMMGLIIVVGMLVDDAIVVTESIQKKMEDGLSPHDAAVQGTERVWRPVTTSVLTTMAAFLPLMDLDGVFGKFIRHIPIGVMVALAFSLVECLFLLPSHVASWGHIEKKQRGGFWDRSFVPGYRSLTIRLLKYRYLVFLSSTAWILGTGFFAWQNLPFRFFPGTEKSEFSMKLEAPKSSSQRQYMSWIEQVESLIHRVGGEQLQWVSSTYDDEKHEASFLISVKEPSDVKLVMGEVKEKAQLPEGVSLKMTRRHSGPSSGKPLSFRILGQNIAAMDEAAVLLMSEIENIPGASDATRDEKNGRSQLLMKIHADQQRQVKVSSREAMFTLQAHLDGIVAHTLPYQGEDLDVRLGVFSKKMKRDDFENLGVMSSDQRVVKLKNFASFKAQEGLSQYVHSDGRRVLEIEAEYEDDALPQSELQIQLKTLMEKMALKFPDLSFEKGADEKSRKSSLMSLQFSMVLTVVGIFLLLVLQFQNLVQPFLIVYLIPLAVVSVLWAFYFHGVPLSFLGGVGMIALAGVVVNNGIVLLDAFNQHQDDLSAMDAVVAAALDRIRPIVMTTLTTGVGILPTAYGFGGKDPFVVPIALALGWGVVMGACVTLLVLPSLLLVIEDLRRGFRFFKF